MEELHRRCTKMMLGQLPITQHIRYAPSVLALQDIAPFDRNVVYAGNDDTMIRNFGKSDIESVCEILNACVKDRWWKTTTPKHFQRVVIDSAQWKSTHAYSYIQHDNVLGIGVFIPEGNRGQVVYLFDS